MPAISSRGGTNFPYHALRIGKMFTAIEFKCPIFQRTESGTYDAARSRRIERDVTRLGRAE